MKTSNSPHCARNCLLGEGRDTSEIPVSRRAVSVHVCVYTFISSRARDGKCTTGASWLNRLWWWLTCSLWLDNEVVRMTYHWRIPTSTSREGPISCLLRSLSVLINLIFPAATYPILRWGYCAFLGLKCCSCKQLLPGKVAPRTKPSVDF